MTLKEVELKNVSIHCITKANNDICNSILEERLEKTYMNIYILNSEL